jgi:lysophospholipase L1-like esterase
LLFLLLFIPGIIFSQDPLRFKNEIDTIIKKYSPLAGRKNLIVFTGSSSIRKWQNIFEYFPGKNIINTAFGGSQMSDLIFYSEQAIIRYKPIQVFIYEGDNDLGAGEKAADIFREADSLIKMIHKKLNLTEIVLLSAKPSPLRWALKDEFIKLNGMLRQLPSKYDYVRYIDLWTPLIGPSGKPVSDYFLSDSLHLNNSGYGKWAPIIGKVLK